MAQEILDVGTSAGSGDGEPLRTGMIKVNNNFSELYVSSLFNRIEVNQDNAATLLGGTIDSTKEYFIDGTIDMSGITVTVPATGMKISGLGSNISMLFCTDDNYTMFESELGGCGDFIHNEIEIKVTGTNSSVYALTSTGTSVWEISRSIWTDCTSLGYLDSFVQGLENVTSRLGGTPELEFIGNWISGYKIETSNSRGLASGSYSLFKAGAGFVINGRFASNQLCDLPASASLTDFSPSNLANPSALQFENVFLSRNGVFDSTDPLLTPNITNGDLKSSWRNCVGLSNTHEGGTLTVTTETETVVSVVNTYYDLEGIYTASDLEHFDSPANGQLRHLGNSPREYNLQGNLVIDGGANDEVWLKIVVWDNSASTFVDYKITKRVISNNQGGRDVGYFNFLERVLLDQNDYAKLMVANVTDVTNVTAELDSEFIIEAR